MEKASQDFVFTEVAEKPVLSALRDFSAPVKLQVRYWHLKHATVASGLQNHVAERAAFSL